MSENDDAEENTVSVSMELSGDYEDVMSKLHAGDGRRTDLNPLVSDLDVLLETVVRINGGTRSAIAQQLPDEMAASLDAQAVVDTMQVLERYDLVVLEGNTWKPGPTLQERSD